MHATVETVPIAAQINDRGNVNDLRDWSDQLFGKWGWNCSSIVRIEKAVNQHGCVEANIERLSKME